MCAFLSLPPEHAVDKAVNAGYPKPGAAERSGWAVTKACVVTVKRLPVAARRVPPRFYTPADTNGRMAILPFAPSENIQVRKRLPVSS